MSDRQRSREWLTRRALGGEDMSANGHHTAAEIRSRLDHPVVDGDGHWVEFDPVFSERLRKVGGDKAAEGFLAAMKTTTDALSMTVAERKRRRVAQPGFWTRQASNTLDRATAMMPRLLYERLDEIDRISRSFIRPPACACRESATTPPGARSV